MTVNNLLAALFIIGIFLICPSDAHAYIGPGAGFAFVSSFFILFYTFFMAFVQICTWPIRLIVQSIRGRWALRKSRVRRVVILGLDGQDPVLTDQFLKEGILPNFAKLRNQGCYRRLRTSLPAESPVAWSCFQTGCNPGRHKVFDFLVPNRKSYLPELCSAQIGPPRRNLTIGKYKIPLGGPQLQFTRKSQSFWKILGDHGVFSTILRVPISFPPEKFKGVMLSAMAVPDLKGTQGTFSYYSSDPHEHAKYTAGMQFPVEVKNGVVKSHIAGPANTMLKDASEIRIPFEVRVGTNGAPGEIIVEKTSYPLVPREYTSWIPLNFRPGFGIKVRGMVRFYLKETYPHFKLYMTPINIDPEKPALPISQPFTYAIYLARTLGRFCTLGLAEDTWALNERVIDEEAFLKQTYLIHEEREKMWFDAIDKTRRGAVVCVFDITDRLQHMFFRYIDPGHPANEGKDTEKHKDAIRDLYIKMDELVGKTIDALKDESLLFVMSDHGFKPFRRGVNLNSWLHQNGYLVLKEGASPGGSEWLQDVDWSKTRAYAIGLGGIYLNVVGREAKGIVKPGEDEKALRKEIVAKLRGFMDPKRGEVAVREVHDCKEVYQGPYVREAPDLFAGFAIGYRASWSCATGVVAPEIFEDNVKSWSGDHCMNPADVPGILFCNRKYEKESPSIMDLGPTVLDMFGVKIPAYCDGESLFPDTAVIQPEPAAVPSEAK
ncbi:alkaline phosphatase family protein [Candidatus Sumerlaeota bacterium]|nr:alkaline phosphatase family protein [Candidatus Sumerlaeota bacterium]